MYLSNENSTPVEVYFDDFDVKHTQSPIVAGADYYPFGLAMEGREIQDEPYRYGYQGQFSEKDVTTGQQEFQLRNYDARVGRWTTPDPYGQFASPYLAMANQPNMMVDPDGGCTPQPCIDLGEIVVQGERIVSTRVLPAISSSAASTIKLIENAGKYIRWYADADRFGNFLTSENGLRKEVEKGFLGATKLAGSIDYGYTGLDIRGGDYDDTAVKVGQGASVAVSLYTAGAGGGYPQGGVSYAIPNNGPLPAPSLAPEINVIAPTGILGEYGTVNASGSVKFPTASELAKKLKTTVDNFHKNIKPQIKKDFSAEMRKIGSDNPDIGIDDAGNIVLKNPRTGQTINTNVPLDAYIP